MDIRVDNEISNGWIIVERSYSGEVAYIGVNNPVRRSVARLHLTREETVLVRDYLNRVLNGEAV